MGRAQAMFHMLDVGQGCCCVWTSPKTDIVIDANIPSEGIGTYVKGYLIEKAGVASPITRFILTGWDNDHANPTGVGMITRNFEIERVWIPEQANLTDCAKQVKKLLKGGRWKNGYDVYYPSTDRQRHIRVEDTTIEVFGPHPDDTDCSNNCSIVAKLSHGGFSVLITGDCEQARWDSIVRYFAERLGADVLVAPHHGSRNGITKEALEAIRPKLVLISAGDHAGFNHPHPEAVALYRKHVGEHICVTKKHGNIWVRSGEPGVVNYGWQTPS